MQTLLGTLGSPEEADDRPARSSLPWVWFGFVFAIAFLVAEFLEVFLELDSSFQILFVVLVLAGWVFWLFCVHRFHKILEEMTSNRYAIGAAEAVGKHFIPFYNLYWIFAWPMSLASHLSNRQIQILPGGLIGFALLASVLLRYVDGALGLGLTFAVGAYLSAKLRKHMKAVESTSPDKLPPLPDPSMFQPSPTTAELQADWNSRTGA